MSDTNAQIAKRVDRDDGCDLILSNGQVLKFRVTMKEGETISAHLMKALCDDWEAQKRAALGVLN